MPLFLLYSFVGFGLLFPHNLRGEQDHSLSAIKPSFNFFDDLPYEITDYIINGPMCTLQDRSRFAQTSAINSTIVQQKDDQYFHLKDVKTMEENEQILKELRSNLDVLLENGNSEFVLSFLKTEDRLIVRDWIRQLEDHDQQTQKINKQAKQFFDNLVHLQPSLDVFNKLKGYQLARLENQHYLQQGSVLAQQISSKITTSWHKIIQERKFLKSLKTLKMLKLSLENIFVFQMERFALLLGKKYEKLNQEYPKKSICSLLLQKRYKEILEEIQQFKEKFPLVLAIWSSFEKKLMDYKDFQDIELLKNQVIKKCQSDHLPFTPFFDYQDYYFLQEKRLENLI